MTYTLVSKRITTRMAALGQCVPNSLGRRGGAVVGAGAGEGSDGGWRGGGGGGVGQPAKGGLDTEYDDADDAVAEDGASMRVFTPERAGSNGVYGLSSSSPHRNGAMFRDQEDTSHAPALYTAM